MDLTIIIVNYRTPGLILNCLQTLFSGTGGIFFEVFIVDNASGDDSRELITEKYPLIKWIQLDYNAGFARANNAAIRLSSGTAVLLLNSDTLVEDGAIEGCFRELTASSYIAAGVQLLNPDRTHQISGGFFLPGALNNLLPLPFMGHWVKKTGDLFKAEKPHISGASSLVEADWINGAFLMVKRAAFEKTGLMDEDFFLYAEESEWCSRLQRLGRLCIYGQFHIVHLQGASANETFETADTGSYNLYDRKGFQIMLSSFVRIRKQYGSGWFLFHLFFYGIEIPVFLLGLFISSLPAIFRRPKAKYSLLQWRQYSSNVCRLIALAPTIVRNKPHFYKAL